MSESIETIGQTFHWMDRQLQDLYPDEERTSMVYLVFRHLLNCSRFQIHERFHANLPISLQIQIREIVSGLLKNKPIQYMLGTTEFYGLKFKIRPGVLIPRQETEELVDWIIQDVRHTNSLTILDIGCGSGCISVSLAKNLPWANVYATDIAGEALVLTVENAGLNHCRVHVLEHDIFSSLAGLSITSCQVLVSNPPYIPQSKKSNIQSNVADHEPETALFVPDNDPLVYYRRLAEVAEKLLSAGGRIYVEIHELFGKEISELFLDKGFSEVILRKDINEKDRMVSARWH